MFVPRPRPAARRSRWPLAALWVVAAVATVLPLHAGAQGAAPLTVERIVSGPSILGTAPVRPTWSPDSRQLAFLWNDAAWPARDVWLVDRDGSSPRRLTRFVEGAPPSGPGVSDLAWSPDSRTIYVVHRGDVWRVAAQGGTPEALTRTGGSKTQLSASPDGKYVSFVQDGDLWLVHLDVGRVSRATRVGVPTIGSVPLGTYYRADVEIGTAIWGGGVPVAIWSPDSRFVAVHYVDRRAVRETPYPYYLGDEVVVNHLRRGYPGDTNEIRTVGFYEVATGQLRLLDLPDQTSIQTNDFAWSPEGRLLIDRQSDDALDRWLVVADPVSHSFTTAWHDRRESRVYTAIASAWHGDGERLLFVSDLEDRYRLYTVAPGETTPRALTPATWDVTGERGAVTPIASRATKSVFVVGNEASPYERHVYRVPEDGGPAVRVTTSPGVHVPFLSPDGSTLALLHSHDVMPTELFLVDAKGGPERRITTSPPAEFGRVPWVKARYATFKSRIDGHTLHARILEPANLDRSKKYPVIFGPVYSNTVRNRFAGLYATLQQLLVIERGYIVVQVDVRGSTGYGRDFREGFLMDWGGKDLDDLESAVDHLRTLPYVDPARVGIWGSSYGGTLTVFSLLRKPGLFRAGVAGAPAVDPRYFGSDDVAISRRPQTHPETFVRGNVVPEAKNLRDALLIIHGMMDDVVPFKTSIDLAEQLIKEGKDFDFAFAPAATHGWSQRPDYAIYLLGKLVTFFDRHLGPGPGAAVSQDE